MQKADPRIGALADTVTGLLSVDEVRKRLAGLISGLDIWYDLGEGHPLLGRRMPDLDVVTAAGPLRVFTLLHAARAVDRRRSRRRDGNRNCRRNRAGA